MAKHKKNELRHNWRSIYFKILKNFTRSKYISSFEVAHSATKEVHCFVINTIQNRTLKINFYNSKYRDKVMLGADFFDNISIMVGKFAQPKALEILLKSSIDSNSAIVNIGIKIEDLFFDRVLLILNRAGISNIRKATTLQDINGIDFYLTYQNKLVPLQLKLSKSAQEEHIKKFPLIPSFVFVDKNYTDRLLEIFLIKICDAYINGRILHS